MALARMCLRSTLPLCGRRSFPLPAVGTARGGITNIHFGAPSPYSAVPDHHSSPKREDEKKGGEVEPAATESSSPSSPARRRRGLLSVQPWDLIPFRFHGTGLGNALWQLSENLNRLLENWAPSRAPGGRMKEVSNCYKLRYEVPGLRKEDMKITVEDGFLVITGERKEEEDDTDEEGGWYFKRYGCFNTSLLLPDDAKVEEIKAEVKDGILCITIPRDEEAKRNVREVEIQ